MKKDIKEITKKLNLARIEAGNRVFKNHFEFKDYLKNFGLKVGNDLLANMLYATVCKDGKFLSFPIYMGKVESIYNIVAAKTREYYQQNKMKKANKLEKEMIDAIIDLLKSKGYKVLKPVTEYKEI